MKRQKQGFRGGCPNASCVAPMSWLINAADTSSKPILDQIQNAGKMTGIEIAPPVFVRSPGEIDAAFTTIKKEGADAVVLQGSIAAKIAAELALTNRLPAATAFRTICGSWRLDVVQRIFRGGGSDDCNLCGQDIAGGQAR
jgi:hypothetical protein